MSVEPVHFTPILVDKPWGGRRLARFGRDLPDGALIGESWEVADLVPDSTSVTHAATRVAAGPDKGATLSELILRDGSALLGDAAPVGGRFPLLVKLLDAREHLSVQVHPTAEYVDEHPAAHLKTESWVVMDAEPGAELMLGLADGVTMHDLRNAAGTPAMVPLLRRVTARVGDVHHLPAGTIHALGAGVMVAEVQTPSDTTFRLYDWAEKYHRPPRDLHLEAALASIELGWEHNFQPPGPRQTGGALLVDTPHYRLIRHTVPVGDRLESTLGRARVMLVISGHLTGDGLACPLHAGGVVLLPAAWDGSLDAHEDTTVLEMTP